MARRWWEFSKDPDDYMGKSRRERRREEEAEDQGPEPQLHPRGHWGLIAATVAVWVVAMAFLHVHWWDFERHGPWLTPATPFALAGALEGLIIRRRPDLDRHHEGGREAARRGAAAIGDRARPYWAREGHDALGAGETGAPADPPIGTAAEEAPRRGTGPDADG